MGGNGDDKEREKTDDNDMERSDDKVEEIQVKIDNDNTTINYVLLSSLKYPIDPAHVQKHSTDYSDRFVKFCCSIGLVSQLKVSQKLRRVHSTVSGIKTIPG